MEKSEPILIGDIIRRMLSDPRIQALLDDYGMTGLGTYIYLRNVVEAQSPGGLPLGYVVKTAISSHTSRNRILQILRNYGLFSEDEFGLVHACALTPGHGTPTHASPTHGMHEHTEGDNSNNKNNLSDTNQSVVIRRRFQKPTVEEVDAYCRQRRNRVDATRFCNFYESKGWMVGKSKMVDWKAAVRTWERNSEHADPNPGPHPDPDGRNAGDGNAVTTSAGIRYYHGRPLPPDAPPRPSSTAQWDFATDSWNDFY